MDGYTKQLNKILKKNGCYLIRTGKGDHEIWFRPISKIHFTVDGKILSRHTALQMQ